MPDILALARQAGIHIADDGSHVLATPAGLREFAALVAAQEREACALIAGKMTARHRLARGAANGEPVKGCEIAAAIRARKDAQ